MWRRLAVIGRGVMLLLSVVVGAVGEGASAASAATGTVPTRPHTVATMAAHSQAMPTFGPNQWLTLINYYRSASGVPPVTASTSWATGIEQHLVYLAKTTPSLMAGQYASFHTENPASGAPFYGSD